VEWLKTVRIFDCVVKNGSLSSAGRTLGISPASVSRHLSALEESLGVRLVNRTSRALSLTEAGEVYYRKVEQILHQINEADTSVAELNSVPRGTLRIHSRVFTGQLFIIPALPEFLERYPGMRVDLTLSNLAADLVDRGIDVDIRVGKLEDSSLTCRKLASSERVICAAPSYLERHSAPKVPEDLQHHNCLTYRLNLGRPIWRFLSASGEHTEVAVTGSFQVDSGSALVSTACAGLGITLMPDWAVRDDLASGRLVRLFENYRVTHMEYDNGIYAVFEKSRFMSGKIRVFVDYISEVMRERLS